MKKPFIILILMAGFMSCSDSPPRGNPIIEHLTDSSEFIATIKRFNSFSTNADVRVMTIHGHNYIILLGDDGVAICPEVIEKSAEESEAEKSK